MGNEPAIVRRHPSRDDETFDVPAAVLCACCGQPDCAGCTPATEEGSGVVAVVPWERHTDGTWTRLWSTAKATTLGANTFFAALPDGAILPAMRFAVLAEGLAVLSMLAALLPLGAIALPGLTLELAQNPSARASAARWLLFGVPCLVTWMILAHAAHGAALDLGASRQGAHPARRRALRFGLYACGWDLMTGPLGALFVLFSEGRKRMNDLLSAAVRAPRTASNAYLEGIHALPPAAAARAQRTGSIAAAALAVISGFAIITALALLL
ncbi:hypothetical protein [Chondromyces crocatus]|uniref:Uncharacterized protein n=1 Tax=Chondromyces crocatus TaxID=52 RepID=A0A0K1EN11_CHOCO|nr:hypothetical protein [Chondromyces crocatus]AKT42290.1 uncharacterized protein CMC5_065130 [Chondromyces crocatus]